MFVLEFISQGSDAKLLQSIIRVGDELSQEHVPVRVQAVDHNFTQTGYVGLNDDDDAMEEKGGRVDLAYVAVVK